MTKAYGWLVGFTYYVFKSFPTKLSKFLDSFKIDFRTDYQYGRESKDIDMIHRIIVAIAVKVETFALT